MYHVTENPEAWSGDYLREMLDDCPEIVLFGNKRLQAYHTEPLREAQQYLEAVDMLHTDYSGRVLTPLEECVLPAFVTQPEGVSVSTLCELYKDYAHGGFVVTADVLARYLTITRHELYRSITLRGCTQSEWQNCVFPDDNACNLDRLEACYFNTGTEWRVEDDSYTDCVYYIYTVEHSKTAVCEELGVDPAEVECVAVCGQHTEYDYAEMED